MAIEAPSDAHVWKVSVAEGQNVHSRQSILTLEAMKMEIDISLPARLDGARLERLMVAPGDVVESGQVLAFVRPVDQSL